MSKPQPASSRPDETGQPDPPSPEELEILRDRDKVYPEQRKAARPADEVVERLLHRHPAP